MDITRTKIDITPDLVEDDIISFIDMANKEHYATRLTDKNFSDKLFMDKITNSSEEYVYLSLVFNKEDELITQSEEEYTLLKNTVQKYVNKDRVFNMIFRDK